MKKLILLLLFLSFTITANATLISFWRMDEPSWNGTSEEVKDVTGTNNGTAVGGATTKVGHEQRAGSFDGTNDYVSVSSNSFPTGNSSLTMELWFKTSGSGVTSMFNYGTWATYKRINLDFNANGSVDFNLHGGDGQVTSGTGYDDGRWHHAVGVSSLSGSTNTYSLYVDGVFIGSDTTNNQNITLDLARIGAATGLSYYFTGLIDEVKIYNHALSQAEVTQAYWEGSNTRLKNATIKNATIN